MDNSTQQQQPPVLLDKAARAAAKKARKEARRAQRRTEAEVSAQEAKRLGIEATKLHIAGAVSVAHRALPPTPPDLKPGAVSICLLYQYREPCWTTKQHKKALNDITEIASRHCITGRGRCAPEGVNCTLTGSAQDLRDFCYALRAWDPMFDETDFKLTDNQEASAGFRFFTLRNVQELVGYGLEGPKAPSLERHSGKHLEAHEYHQQMQQKDTVIIDVRNAYESAIGHFQPPPGGAALLKPPMRNSLDFPHWLHAPSTKKALQGKTVMMYCTGGIRCERATALLNQMTDYEQTETKQQGDDESDSAGKNNDQEDVTRIEGGGKFQTKDVVMVRGGIERYLKTFPEGGYWKGSNYLFDQRREQVPDQKSADALAQDAAEINSWCCACKKPYAKYRGSHRCGQILTATGLPCNVPVIVCDDCQDEARTKTLSCPLCVEGYQPPTEAPDLLGQKRKLGLIQNGKDVVTGQTIVEDHDDTVSDKDDKSNSSKMRRKAGPSRRLFVGRLPLRITASALRDALQRALAKSKSPHHHHKDGVNDHASEPSISVHWIVDRETKAFYGSAHCEMPSLQDAEAVMEAVVSTNDGRLELGKSMKSRKKREKIRSARVAFCPLRDGEIWPPENDHASEYPPLGIC